MAKHSFLRHGVVTIVDH